MPSPWQSLFTSSVAGASPAEEAGCCGSRVPLRAAEGGGGAGATVCRFAGVDERLLLLEPCVALFKLGCEGAANGVGEVVRPCAASQSMAHWAAKALACFLVVKRGAEPSSCKP